ncbi:tetratricopeptide repeat protein [bacterium]|nr:tetratricopeptide repeat protein [bacterium]
MKSFSQQLIDEARAAFIEGDYATAEPLLNQPTLLNSKNPEVLQMLATIYYDQGKFNKAISTFKKALEIEPSYTDAAVGLSIILNDIGRYDDARRIFDQAKAQLDAKKQSVEPNVNEKFASKHAELADMYLQFKRFEESAEQYLKAISLSVKKVDLILRLSECYVQAGQKDKAIKELKSLLQADPRLASPRLKLGLILYNSHHIAEAVDQWENILRYEPKNTEAIRYLKMAQAAGVTTLTI